LSSSAQTSCRGSPPRPDAPSAIYAKIAESAKDDLREGLGPEFTFEIEDLNPKRFAQKHLLDNVNEDQDRKAAARHQASRQAGAKGTLLAPGERPPCDPDAT
jgi:sec-independent protein translocase protein TatB